MKTNVKNNIWSLFPLSCIATTEQQAREIANLGGLGFVFRRKGRALHRDPIDQRSDSQGLMVKSGEINSDSSE
jgi:hypothetical protein